MRVINLGFLASHRGSNMQAVIDACKTGRLTAIPRLVISNNSGSQALVRAKQEGIPCYHLSARTHPEPDRLDVEILNKLAQYDVDIVILAGYMRKLGQKTINHYAGRILNIHPALLSRFGGKGMYGSRVHEAVLAAGEEVSGVTIHLTDEKYDTGPIIAQCLVPVLENDTAETLAARVLEREHSFLVETLDEIASGKIILPDIKL